MNNTENKTIQKSDRAKREEEILAFWKEKNIFKKTLEQTKNGEPFIFYEGPPTANGKPGIHHLEARAFKDAIPRYKTMQGYSVHRKGGWDTHGLPVELQVEKELGLKSKKEIEAYGIAEFNKKCKESVWAYVDLWEKFTDRIGYWVDQENPYVTYHNNYIESVWNILAKVEKDNLLYKDYKVVPWCPRCGTALSSHELAQGYADVKDLSVYVKFKVKGEENTYLLAWTTTPWTLPGNVALAVNLNIKYFKLTVIGDKNLPSMISDSLKIGKSYIASAEFWEKYGFAVEVSDNNIEAITQDYRLEILPDLKDLEYEPLYPYLSEQISGTEKEKLINAYKVYAADFVTTTDGTGIVHTAVMYGQDDFELGTKVGLPKYHLVDESGHFIKGTGFLEDRFVKDEETAVEIIKDLAHRGLLFKKEKYEHSYPHCWRCKTPLIYYARDSWYIHMSKLREQLVSENNSINWEPVHIKEGRFGEWLREVKDWAISRERYWGTPLPIWISNDGERLVADSIQTLRAHTPKSGNSYFVMRHCQTEKNLKRIWSCDVTAEDVLTEEGKARIAEAVKMLDGKKVDLIITSPFSRTKQTALLMAKALGLSEDVILTDDRLGEWQIGKGFDGKPLDDYFAVRNESTDRYNFKTEDGESYADVMKRSGSFLYDTDSTYKNKNILLVSHGGATRSIELITEGFSFDTLFARTRNYRNFDNGEIREVSFVPLPHNEKFELDLHRPYIDSVILEKDGKEFRRIKEVMDVWFDSGAMPFAQDHYPFENKERIEGKGYPADFISEAIDQTRGWFYTLHAIGVLMGRGKAYKNVICLGHLLDAKGKKMSKSLGNIVDPWEQIEKYGVDTLRLWMFSVNQPGDSKNYDEKTVDEIVKKVFNLLFNVLSFHELYRDSNLEKEENISSGNVLDQWILVRLEWLIGLTTKKLDEYQILIPVRAIRQFIEDLSTWYLRRSRERIKDGDIEAKRTLYTVLKVLAKIMAPFAPFSAEDIWQKLKTVADEESIHLSKWPSFSQLTSDQVLIQEKMDIVRELCTLGNAMRKKENIPVRQPLQKYYIAVTQLDTEYKELIKEELNVKEVIEGQETKFDTTITPELKQEGEFRELVRMVQDMRKEKGLQPKEVVTLSLPASYKETITSFEDELKKTVSAKEIVFTDADQIEIK